MAEITIASYDKAVSPAFTGATATLKIWYDRQFLTSDDEIVLAGSVEYPNLEVACTVSGGGFTVTIPQFLIDSTIDGIPPNSRATAILFDADGIHRETVLANFRIPNTPTSTTWPALFIYNQGGLVTLPEEFYNKNEVNALLAQFSAGGVSVTSVELAGAISAVSQALSAGDAGLSTRINSAVANITLNQLTDVFVPTPSDQQALVWNSAAGQWVASTLAAGSGSVTSNELSIAAAGLSGRIDSVANAVSAISQALSALSADELSLKDRVSANSALTSNLQSAVQANSAQMTSADNAISNAVSIVSAACASVQSILSTTRSSLSALSADVTSVKDRVSANSAQMTSADNAISNALSAKTFSSLIGVSLVPTDGQVVMWNSAAAKWQASTVAVGTGSVTSQKMSVAIAVETSNRVSADNALSVIIASNSAQMTSADNAISNAVSIVSQALSVEIVNRTSADNALSVRIDTQSQAISVLSQQISVLSQNLSANSVVLSNTRSAVQANSAQMTSADNAISAAVVVVSALISTVASALSARIDTVSNAIATKNISSLIGVSIPAATNGQVLMFDSAAGQWIAFDVIGGGGSVTSQELSVAAAGLSVRIDSVQSSLSTALSAIQANSAQMTSADNAISNAVSIVSAGLASVQSILSTTRSSLSALSADVTSVKDRVSANSAQMTSADNAISARVDTVSNAISAKTISSLIGVSIASPADQQALVWNSAAAQWVNSTIVGGSGSVTSTELSAVSAAAASADATLSTRIDSVQSSLSTAFSILSVLSQGHSVLSAQHVVLSNKVSNNLSAIQANSAQMVSADNAISNAVSIVSAAHASLLAAHVTLSNKVSNNLSAIQANSAQMTSADNVLSQQVSALSAYVNKAIGSEFDAGVANGTSLVLNWANGRAQKLSITANTPIAAPTNVSAGGRYILRIVQDATGNRQPTWNSTYVWANSVVPTLGGAGAVDILAFYCDGTTMYGSYNDQLSAFQAAANVISNNISVISVAAVTLSNQLSNLQSAASTLSTQLSNLQSVANALSNQISATGAFKQAVLSGGIFTVSATALTNISGLSLSVSANSLYRITGELMYTFSGASSQNAGFGLTFPGMKQAAGRITMFNLGQQATASASRTGAWTGAGSGSNIVSGFTANTSGVQYYGEIRGLFDVSTTGVIQVQAKATSGGAGAIHILQGSNIKLFKIGG